jgi:hypothetical protein
VQPGERTAAGGKRVGVDHDHVPQIVAGRQGRRQQRQALGRGDQRPHIAVAHDVGDLIGLEQGVERHEDAAGGGRAKTGDDGLEALLEVDGDPLAALQAEADEAADEAFDRLLQHAVAHRLFAVAERDGGSNQPRPLRLGRSLVLLKSR